SGLSRSLSASSMGLRFFSRWRFGAAILPPAPPPPERSGRVLSPAGVRPRFQLEKSAVDSCSYSVHVQDTEMTFGSPPDPAPQLPVRQVFVASPLGSSFPTGLSSA